MSDRSALRRIDLKDAIRDGVVTVTMSVGQWDTMLSVFYEDGAVLLELDEHEQPVAAYQRAAAGLQ